MLVPVSREKPGNGRRFQGNFTPQDGADEASDRAAGGLKGTVKGGQGRGIRGIFRETFRQEPQLGRGTASINTFKNGKIVYT
jgi:hypothetical protein